MGACAWILCFNKSVHVGCPFSNLDTNVYFNRDIQLLYIHWYLLSLIWEQLYYSLMLAILKILTSKASRKFMKNRNFSPNFSKVKLFFFFHKVRQAPPLSDFKWLSFHTHGSHFVMHCCSSTCGSLFTLYKVRTHLIKNIVPYVVFMSMCAWINSIQYFIWSINNFVVLKSIFLILVRRLTMFVL